MTRPWFHSERGATGAISKACRPAAGATCTMLATDNEANLNRWGRPLGKRSRIAIVKKGWQAFATQKPADANGWADQGDVHRMHRSMFPGLPLPLLRQSQRALDVWDAIGENAVSLAIDTSAVNAQDPIRRYVGAVGHQVPCVEKRTRNGEKQVRIADPMHMPSDSYIGHWVTWQSLQKCARAVEGGLFIFELYPVGKWTAAAMQTADLRGTVRSLRDTVAKQADRIDDLEAQVGDDDCEEAMKAAREQLLDSLGDWLTEQRGSP